MVVIASDKRVSAIASWLRRAGDVIAHAAPRVRGALNIGHWLRPAKRFAGRYLPTGLYPRSLIIVIAPIVLLQSIVVMIFLERHWEMVTEQLSRAVTRDIALLIDLYGNYPYDDNYQRLIDLARDQLEMAVSIHPGEALPADQPRPFFRLLDRTLSKEITERVGRPFWLDTLGKSGFVEIRIQTDDAIFRVIAQRSRTYASNSHIFILWMVGSSLVLLTGAIIILRNQIRPIQRLAAAAEAFGLGRNVEGFRPSGAAEVQRAARAFIRMRERIERQIEQRTTMLAGVSHDLRTLLTRFKLQLAFLGERPEVSALERDVNEMRHMLEDYLAFARGDGGEVPAHTDISAMIGELACEVAGECRSVETRGSVPVPVMVKPNAFKRCIWNLVQNAARHAECIRIAAQLNGNRLLISIDDDGPGIAEQHREDVFKPFFRLDDARNQDTGGTGLGLAIARDISMGHGGDITLGTSDLGGLKATVSVPV
jgi:two-component system osmolarity sensor histidine kinase EnvZ